MLEASNLIAEAGLGTASVSSAKLAASAKELFLQLQTPGVRKVNFGTLEIEWESGKNASKEVEIEHGLGTTPQVVTGNFGFNASFVAYAAIGTYTSTKFLVQGFTTTAPGTAKKSPFKWMAIA